MCVISRTAYVSDSNRKQEKRKFLVLSESEVLYFFATKILHIIWRLFLQLLLTSFTIFSRSHVLCWCTWLGGKSILLKPIDRRWTNEHATMRAPHVPLLHCHAISWYPRPLACVCVYVCCGVTVLGVLIAVFFLKSWEYSLIFHLAQSWTLFINV